MSAQQHTAATVLSQKPLTARVEPVTTDHFGSKIADPYHWMESGSSDPQFAITRTQYANPSWSSDSKGPSSMRDYRSWNRERHRARFTKMSRYSCMFQVQIPSRIRLSSVLEPHRRQMFRRLASTAFTSLPVQSTLWLFLQPVQWTRAQRISSRLKRSPIRTRCGQKLFRRLIEPSAARAASRRYSELHSLAVGRSGISAKWSTCR